MKKTTPLTAFALLTLASPAFSALSYSYSYSLMPGHEQGTTIYADDLHSDNGVGAGTFDATGDLNDGVIYGGGGVADNPVTDGGGVNSMVGWSSVGGGDTPSTITVDLGGFYTLTSVDLTTYGYAGFNLGHPDDVTISTSTDNLTYGASTLHTLNASPTGHGFELQSIARTDAGIRYIKLDFDGDETAGDKWGLTELAIQGAPVPEPSSTALLSLGGLALILRRRK